MVDRSTDANPVYVLDEAWIITQIQAAACLFLRATSDRAASILTRQQMVYQP
jgi:hypothetical protein